MPEPFAPPQYIPPRVQPWATYIADRRPPFKVHATKAHAYAAVNLVDNWEGRVSKRGGTVYKLEAGWYTPGVPGSGEPHWVEHERIERA